MYSISIVIDRVMYMQGKLKTLACKQSVVPLEKIDLLELRYDEQFTMMFEMLKKLTMPPDVHVNRKIGFKLLPK